jgi:hypothetical protein
LEIVLLAAALDGVSSALKTVRATQFLVEMDAPLQVIGRMQEQHQITHHQVLQEPVLVAVRAHLVVQVP